LPATASLILLALFATQSSAQTTAGAAASLRLTVEEAVRMAGDNNVDLKADRLDPQIGDMRVAAAAAIFKPVFSTSLQRNDQLQPPASFLIPLATETNLVTSNVGINQRLPWLGTSYSMSWNTSHTNSNSFLTSYNPLLQSGLSLNVSQPLFRDLFTDSARVQLAVNQTNRSIAGIRVRESEVHTQANVKTAYWNLVAARANVEAKQSALKLAEELVRVNKAKVDVGQSPPIDLVSAQAEVASNQEQLIVAETAVKQAEDRLRLLIFDATDRNTWNVKIEPIDSPPVAMVPIDVDAAVTNALRDRTDLTRARKDIENAQLNQKLANNQKLPDIRLNASYQASGLGGTEVLRAGGFPGTIIGPGSITSFGSVLNQLVASNYPTWAVGVSISYPIGQSTEEATYARTKLETAQSEERLKSSEARVIQQVRDAAWTVEMNGKRIETTRAARALAEERVNAEQKRFEVGMSTSFLVIQAQRDLAQAKTNELSSVLDYDLALVNFETVQQAGPAGQAMQSAPAGAVTAAAAPAVTGAATALARPTAVAAPIIPGIF
jgi:outer membrane protein TolC